MLKILFLNEKTLQDFEGGKGTKGTGSSRGEVGRDTYHPVKNKLEKARGLGRQMNDFRLREDRMERRFSLLWL